MIWSARLAACVLVALLLVPARPAAQDALAAARDLYASAAYGDALAMLNSLAAAGGHSLQQRQAIDLYRTLCLVALGRKAEADEMVESMIEEDPLYRPQLDDLPPRIRHAFTDTRKRLLPGIIQKQYAQAKAAFDRREYPVAERGFKQVLTGLADPDIAPETTAPPLADLRTLAEGFHDLSAKAAEPPPLPPAPAPAPAPAPDLTRIYGIDDRNVVPPRTIRQRIPPLRTKIVGDPVQGVVEVVIGQSGAVDSVRMVVPTHGPLDHLVLNEAKKWQYEPATLDGMPVRFRKQVRVSVQPTPPEP